MGDAVRISQGHGHLEPRGEHDWVGRRPICRRHFVFCRISVLAILPGRKFESDGGCCNAVQKVCRRFQGYLSRAQSLMFVTFFHELKAAGVPVTMREYLTLMTEMGQDLA